MVDVLIPWRPGCPHRQAALAHILDRYDTIGLRTVIGECPPGPWRKALAVDAAIAHSTADLFVVADGDVWCDGLPDAIEAVEDGAPWAVPHRLVHRLTEAATAAVLAGGPLEGDTAERPYKGRPGGGITVIRRTTYEQVPLDPAFAGWGQEDDSHALALRCLTGEPWRGMADLWHLWHPPQERRDRGSGSPESVDRYVAYKRAKKNPEAMRQLVGR